ncbi:MAG: hypothetical protein ACRD4L_05700 [Pyrinomonadaceae bacterium]
MAKHITYQIKDGAFEWSRNETTIATEEQLDGIYVIRTSEKELLPADVVRTYKNLTQVEEACSRNERNQHLCPSDSSSDGRSHSRTHLLVPAHLLRRVRDAKGARSTAL